MNKNKSESKDNSLQSLNSGLGDVLKGTHATEFSDVLENFKFSKNTAPQVIPPAAPAPIINVSPVQVVQMGNKSDMNNMKSQMNELKKEINSLKKPSAVKTKKPSAVKTKKPSAVKTKKPSVVKNEKPSVVKNKKPSVVKNKEPKRSFTTVSISKHGNCPTKFNEGRFLSRNPAGAAKKAFNEHCRVKNIRGICALHVTLKETTQGSQNKLFTYKLQRRKLEKPIVRLEGTDKQFLIEYTIKVKSVPTPTICTKPGKSSGRMRTKTARKTKPSVNKIISKRNKII
jgi:hypothetical protein